MQNMLIYFMSKTAEELISRRGIEDKYMLDDRDIIKEEIRVKGDRGEMGKEKMAAYSLIEMSISLIIIGVMSLSLFQLINTLQYSHKEQLTKYRQQIVLKALGDYVSKHSFLPYPCTGAELDIGISQENPSVIRGYGKRSSDGRTFNDMDGDGAAKFDWSSVNAIGVVPWRTLGISKETALDGHGRPMIYIMNPVLGPSPEIWYNPPEYNTAMTYDKMMSNFRTIYKNFFYRQGHELKKSADRGVNEVKSEKYTSTRHDLIYEKHYDNFISLHYYAYDQYGNYSENAICSGNGEQTVMLPLTVNDELKTVDCVAVVLISHGSSEVNNNAITERVGNPKSDYVVKSKVKSDDVKKDFIGMRGSDGNIAKEIESNLREIKGHKSPFNNDHIKIYINSPDGKFDQKVAYVMRFGFHLYGGPVLNNHHVQKGAKMQIDLRKDVTRYRDEQERAEAVGKVPYVQLYKNEKVE